VNTQFDPTQKLKWNIAYIAAPGSGPPDTECKKCVHLIEETEPIPDSELMRHHYFCGKVVLKVGRLKEIHPDTPSCSEYMKKARKK
jgi:hypothetical protein